jgi:hypothetical protein
MITVCQDFLNNKVKAMTGSGKMDLEMVLEFKNGLITLFTRVNGFKAKPTAGEK